VASQEVSAAIETTARESYGRLVAYLAARSGDVAAAEDALADAFRAALNVWPKTGVPEKPEGWLLVAARRRLIDRARHQQIHDAAVPTIEALTVAAQSVAEQNSLFPDERLKLLFVCAHPAIDANLRTPLMLQTVLGLDASRIASAFVVTPAAMGKRLTRAKAKIRESRIPFAIPEASELTDRIDAVLEAIYAMFTLGWDDVSGADARSKDMTDEAVTLGRLVVQQLPEEPEPKGLLALMLYCEARRPARINERGEFVPLSQQDTGRWSMPMIHEAHHLLLAAQRAGKVGHFQLEAAIQSVHTRRAIFGGGTDWEEIALLYEGLARTAPTTGVLVARAGAAAHTRGAAFGWELLQAIPEDAVRTYQPYWAQAAEFLEQLGRTDDACAALERAIGLTENRAPRDFLMKRLARLRGRG
jgi:RNA polymerase sigma-70 factor (ECF subfamily)